MNALTTILFSRNRYFQLKEVLRTMKTFVPSNSIVVLAKYDIPAPAGYWELPVFDGVTVVDECEFDFDVRRMIASISTELVMFAVDDMVFFRRVPVDAIQYQMKCKPRAYGFHSRLHPGVSRCGSCNGELMSVPHFELVGSLLRFNRRLGTLDWNYPFEADGGIYRTGDIRGIMHSVPSLRNPSPFEGRLCAAARIARWSNTGLCMNEPRSIGICINKVNEDTDAAATVIDCLYSLDELNSHIEWEIDEDWFTINPQNQVHVGCMPIRKVASC